jgi:hypothetical protein
MAPSDVQHRRTRTDSARESAWIAWLDCLPRQDSHSVAKYWLGGLLVQAVEIGCDALERTQRRQQSVSERVQRRTELLFEALEELLWAEGFFE